MCGPLMSKVKLLFANPKKNMQLAQNIHLLSIIDLVAEYLLPQYCSANYEDPQKLSTMHSLCFLLASKVQAVFTSGVIRTCIDQNWDMKGVRAVILRILQEMHVPTDDYRRLQEFFDKQISSQNLQTQSCIRAISSYLKNRTKTEIDKDDLKNPITSFQTTFEFVKEEILKFKAQNMSYSCFTTLHPWAYDLDLVDFKYVINKDQTAKIQEQLSSSFYAQVLWLTYFKSQLSVSADEFFGALREVAIMNGNVQIFEEAYESQYKRFMHENNFVVSLIEHKAAICEFVEYLVNHFGDANILKGQVKLRDTLPRQSSELLEEGRLSQIYQMNEYILPTFEFLKKKLKDLSFFSMKNDDQHMNLSRQSFSIKPQVKQTHNLVLKFTNVDTEELKDLEIKFAGNQALFKVGEGDCNHYVITNDKKLWESQFMIVNHHGKYYIRDLGVVHTSRVKVNHNTCLQIHKGSLLDLGKVVHYHVDKLFHEAEPNHPSTSVFNTMKGTSVKYMVDEEAVLRARPTWISADENKDLVQNEILLEATPKKNVFSIGRSNRRDVEIKLKAVSADHCRIEYTREQGWFIHELEKDKLSSNGTYVFMKSLQQMDDHEPSDMIQLFNGMTISFINYELQIRLEPKTEDELARSVVEQEVEETPDAETNMSLRSQSVEVPVSKQQDEGFNYQFGETKEARHMAEIHHEEPKEQSQASHRSKQAQSEAVKSHHEENKHEEQHFSSPAKSHHPDEEAKSMQHQPSQKSIRGSVQCEDDKRSQKDNLEDIHHPHHDDQSQPHSKLEFDQNPRDVQSQMGHHPSNLRQDEEHHDMQRSYSQHHIGEVVDKAKQSPDKSIKQAINSNHEDKMDEQYHEQPAQHEEAKSHRSLAQSSPEKQEDVKSSTPQNQQQEDSKSHHSVSPSKHDAQENQSVKQHHDKQDEASVHEEQDQVSVNNRSERASAKQDNQNDHQSVQQQEENHDNQSVHHQSLHQESPLKQDEDVKSQNQDTPSEKKSVRDEIISKQGSVKSLHHQHEQNEDVKSHHHEEVQAPANLDQHQLEQSNPEPIQEESKSLHQEPYQEVVENPPAEEVHQDEQHHLTEDQQHDKKDDQWQVSPQND